MSDNKLRPGDFAELTDLVMLATRRGFGVSSAMVYLTLGGLVFHKVFIGTPYPKSVSDTYDHAREQIATLPLTREESAS